MKLSDQQFLFAVQLNLLYSWLIEKGYKFTLGEAHRTPEQQDIYLQQGKTKVKHSLHQDRLAQDLNIFIDGQLTYDRHKLKPIGDFWESLSPENRWGGSWRGLIESGKSTFVDTPHFERRKK